MMHGNSNIKKDNDSYWALVKTEINLCSFPTILLSASVIVKLQQTDPNR